MCEKSWHTPRRDGLVDGRLDVGAHRLICEGFVETARQGTQHGEGIRHACHGQLVCQRIQPWGKLDEAARLKAIPGHAVRHQAVQCIPRRLGQRLGPCRHGLDLHLPLGRQQELGVRPGHVEMMDRVAEIVLVRRDRDPRLDGEREGTAALQPLGTRLHTNLHHTLPDGCAVLKPRDVADGVMHNFAPVDWRCILNGQVYGIIYRASTRHTGNLSLTE